MRDKQFVFPEKKKNILLTVLQQHDNNKQHWTLDIECKSEPTFFFVFVEKT